jgi:hypothetical protein
MSKIMDVMIGIFVLILATLVVTYFTFDALAPYNYNVSVENDTALNKLSGIQTNMEASFNSSYSTFNDMSCNTPGGNCSNINPDSQISEGDLLKSSFTAISLFQNSFSIYKSIVSSFGSIIGLSSEANLWFTIFFTIIVGFIIIFALINAVTKNPL